MFQGQRDLVLAGTQIQRFVCEDEKTFFARFHFVIAGRNVVQQEAAGPVGFGVNISARVWGRALVTGALQRDFCGGDGHAIFVDDYADAVRQVPGANLCGEK